MRKLNWHAKIGFLNIAVAHILVLRLFDGISETILVRCEEWIKKYAKTDADKNLAGTTKKYSVTVKQIKVSKLPALDDDLAQDVSDKYKTLADLKADILKNLNIAKDRKIIITEIIIKMVEAVIIITTKEINLKIMEQKGH